MTFKAGAIESALGLDVDPFAKGMVRATGIMAVFPAQVTNFLVNPMLGFVGVAGDVARAFVGIAADGIKLAAQMEQSAIAFEVMTGSAAIAKQTLGELRNFANTTPFEFPEIVSAGKQLLGMGIEAGDLVGTLRMLGDVGSGLGQPLGEMAYLFGQIRSQGRAMTQDLNQFAARGMPIYRELAAVLKTTEIGVRDLASEGKIGFAEIQQAFQRMTTDGGAFAGMTERQSQSLAGLYSTLQDAWTSAKTQLGDALAMGEEGHTLLDKVTATVNDLGPALTAMGVSAAKAFSAAMPFIEKMLTGTSDLLNLLSQTDMMQSGSSSYAAGHSGVIDRLQANAVDLDHAIELAKSYSTAFSTSAMELKKMTDSVGVLGALYAFAPGLGDQIEAALNDQRGKTEEYAKAMIELQAQARSDGPIDVVKFEAAKVKIQELAAATELLQRLQSRAASVAQSSWLNDEKNAEIAAGIDATIEAYEGVVDRLAYLRERGPLQSAARSTAGTEADFFAGAQAEAKEKTAAEANREVQEEMRRIGRVSQAWFDAENKKLENTLDDSDAKLAIFDRETQRILDGIDTQDERSAQAALREQQRIGMVNEIRERAAAEESRRKEDQARESKRLSDQVIAEARRMADESGRRFKESMGLISSRSSLYGDDELASKFNPANDGRRNRMGLNDVQGDYNDAIRAALRRGNRREADRLRGEKGDVLGDLRDTLGDRVNQTIARGSAMPKINLNITGEKIDSRELAEMITDRFRSVFREEFRSMKNQIDAAAHARRVGEEV